MKKKRAEIMQDLRAAKPPDPEFLRDWAESPSAKQILDRVLAATPIGEGRSDKRSRFGPRLVWGAALLVVVVGLCLISIHLLTGPRAGDSTSPFVESTSVPTQLVSRGEALQEIVSMVQSVQAVGHPLMTGTTTQDLTATAIAMGVLRASDGPGPLLDQPVTRGQMALWLWRAFGKVLSPQTPAGSPSDLGSLTQEEQQAILGLSQAGILDKGIALFRSELPLSESDMSAWIGRIAANLRHEDGTSR